jgi:hypothetical protein
MALKVRLYSLAEEYSTSEKLNAMLQFHRSSKERAEMLAETLEHAAWRLAKVNLDNVIS